MARDLKPHAEAGGAEEWRADFRAAEEQLLDASLAVTPSQRLKWLEEALAFAHRMGALPKRDQE